MESTESAVSTPELTAPVPVTATDHAVAAGDVASYREARRAERAGTPLESSPADSTPATPDGQAASTDASPEAASEPATPRKKGAESRVQELLADRARDRQRLEALERQLADRSAPQSNTDATPAASSPAPLDAPFPTFSDWLSTAGNETREYEDYLDARAEHRIELRESRQQAARAQEARERTVAERNSAFQRQYRDATEADPRVEVFANSLPVPVDHLPYGTQPNALNVLSQEIYQSPSALAALRYFAEHPQERDRFAAFTTQDAVIRAFGKLEATWDSATPAPIPPKFITSATPPPTTLGSRPASTASATDAAVQSGDVSAYKAARLKERLANLR